MLGNFDLLHKILRYSIFSTLAIPIYVFSTKSYEDVDNGDFKLSLSILCLIVIVTTLLYWKKQDYKGYFWRYLDRLVVVAIVSILLYSGNKEVRGFVLLGVLFYMLASTEPDFKESDSYLNHLLFRYFVGIGLIIYIADKPYNGVSYDNIFIGLSSLFTVSFLYMSVKDIKYSKRKSIIF